MLDNKIKILLTYIKNNLETESIFATPCPQTTIEVTGLLDNIAKTMKLSKEEIGEYFNMITKTS